jgi:hypothetical protein
MATETDYMNGGPRILLLKMALADGIELSSDERLTIAAHDAMPRNEWYSDSQVEAKRREIQASLPL